MYGVLTAATITGWTTTITGTASTYASAVNLLATPFLNLTMNVVQFNAYSTTATPTW
jgi:hypothetical protein